MLGFVDREILPIPRHIGSPFCYIFFVSILYSVKKLQKVGGVASFYKRAIIGRIFFIKVTYGHQIECAHLPIACAAHYGATD